jgi:O-antigen/teichoic acid export membrane protein
MTALYRHNAGDYFQYAMVARATAIAICLGFVSNAFGTFLQALEETRYQFITSIANTLAVVVIGLPLTYYGGLWGTILGCIICVSVRGICNLIFLYRVRNNPSKPSSHEPIAFPGPAVPSGVITAEAIAIAPE